MRRSLTRQTLHYLARPHTGLPRGPVGGAAAWRGEPAGWSEELDADGRRAILEDRLEALPVGRWRDELLAGRGFLRVRGVPVQELGQARTEAFFWRLGQRLGVPGAQNDAGDLLGHVQDEGFDHQRDVRAYRTRTRINFHCDTADVVGLLCLSQGASGGGSRLCSSVAVHDEVLARRPDLHPLLFEPFALDTKSEGGLRWFALPPCRYDGRLRTFWHADYFRSVERHPDAPRLSDPQRELLDLVDAVAEELCFEMALAPGDLQLVNNHTVVHGRQAFTDGATRRHLLRLWLSLDEPGDRLAWVRLGLRVLGQRVAQALA